ncbi:MAG: hypothetical protein WC707_02410 [Candidatus Babeliaceae bacterium]|jgi:hypothetical protein
MYILKLGKVKPTLCSYKVIYSNFHNLDLLFLFLEDFGHPSGLEHVSDFLHDSSKDSLTGNSCTADKTKKNTLRISFSFDNNNDDDDAYLEIEPHALLKIIDLYIKTIKMCPKEIIITFNSSQNDTTVESIQ